jgi:hypothetical protein
VFLIHGLWDRFPENYDWAVRKKLKSAYEICKTFDDIMQPMKPQNNINVQVHNKEG